MNLVAVETTTGTTSVALFDDGVLVAAISREAKGDACLPMIDELLSSRSLSARDIARWAVDVGPGSFTGVRVGLSTVKGIAFATGAEVVGVSAFDALAYGHRDVPPSADPSTDDSIVILEAGKGEVYFRVAREMGHAPLATVKTMIAARTEPVIGPGIRPTAEGVGRAALGRPASDLDSLEPMYVRAPDLTKPR